MKPRVTVCLRPDGTFEILLNEVGRDLLVKELLVLDRRWDHFHLDHYHDADLTDRTDLPLSPIAYREGDRVLECGKVLLRPDDWDEEHFPHVMASETAAA